ncbi:carbohydrate esterase [Staphylotrichum tortipilum]|uniref:Carbohydrate esterase n=1 Tax=Staphylotrichum tortipilum TaxID=2831512 RepID=A0AAN6MP05_9PEZI|nr:carbohydrate esterase [Staphylotrichum longicolle]
MDDDHDALKVMVVGDSISHGLEGDWTWRYRIWQWFEEQRIPIRFVGPYTGTVSPERPRPPRPPRLVDDPPDPPPRLRTDGGYAAGVAGGFLANCAHFAANGRQANEAKDLVAEQVATYQPDLCLVELGFNDLGWRRCGAIEVLGSMRTLVDQMRSAKPDVKLAIANIPQRTDLDGREDLPKSTALYNNMLERCIPYWSTAASPIALVRFCENYSCGGSNSDAAYDGLHPNALGEYQLAKAFSETLVSSFSLGRTALTVPKHIPARPLPTPRNFRVVPTAAGIVATWDAVYGAYGYDLQHRFVGDYGWSRSHAGSNRHDWQRLRRGQVVECRVRCSGGDFLKSPWTRVASAAADPATAGPPVNIETHATADGFSIAWDPPPPPFEGEIDRYGIVYFDGDQAGAYPCLVGARGTRAEITGLIPGHRHYITMETWTTAGGGVPAAARAVMVGMGRPRTPTSVRARALDSRTVELSWPEVVGGAGYDIWVVLAEDVCRRLGVRGTPRLGPKVKPVLVDGGPAGGRIIRVVFTREPTVWEWEYAVRAYNGNDLSGLSEWVSPPRLRGEDVSLAEGDSICVDIQYE